MQTKNRCVQEYTIHIVTSVPKLISVALETGEEHLPDIITGWSVTPVAHHGMAT